MVKLNDLKINMEEAYRTRRVRSWFKDMSKSYYDKATLDIKPLTDEQKSKLMTFISSTLAPRFLT